jgi:hypothetical protein
LEMEVKANVN